MPQTHGKQTWTWAQLMLFVIAEIKNNVRLQTLPKQLQPNHCMRKPSSEEELV